MNGGGGEPACLRMAAATAARSGSANIHCNATRSCCTPSRDWAIRSSSRATSRCWRARTGARVVLEAQPPLAPLLGRLAGAAGVVARGEPLPPFDVHCPLGSLPLALKTEPATIPAEGPYLSADDARIAKWRARIEAL